MKLLHTFDRKLATAVAKLPLRFEPIMIGVSIVGGFWYVTVVLPGLFIIGKTYSVAVILDTLPVVATFSLLAEITKLLLRRKRPLSLYVEKMKIKTYSFPSGHAYVSALLSGYLAMLASTYFTGIVIMFLSTVFLLFAFMVGISRVYLGAHFPSDVVAGWVLAGMAVLLITPISERL